jgi:hypothetical protein
MHFNIVFSSMPIFQGFCMQHIPGLPVAGHTSLLFVYLCVAFFYSNAKLTKGKGGNYNVMKVKQETGCNAVWI